MSIKDADAPGADRGAAGDEGCLTTGNVLYITPVRVARNSTRVEGAETSVSVVPPLELTIEQNKGVTLVAWRSQP